MGAILAWLSSVFPALWRILTDRDGSGKQTQVLFDNQQILFKAAEKRLAEAWAVQDAVRLQREVDKETIYDLRAKLQIQKKDFEFLIAALEIRIKELEHEQNPSR